MVVNNLNVGTELPGIYYRARRDAISSQRQFGSHLATALMSQPESFFERERDKLSAEITSVSITNGCIHTLEINATTAGFRGVTFV